MSEAPHQPENPQEQKPDQQVRLEAPPPAEAGDGTELIASLRTDLEHAEAKVEELNSRLLRVAADYQNYARRAEQNAMATRQQQTADIMKALVVVLDHFDRALAVDPATTDTAAVLQGVQMVRTELMRALEGFGVRKIDVQVGDAFDPNRHEALMRQPAEGVQANHVTMQLQPGYSLGDRTIRAAKVAVAP